MLGRPTARTRPKEGVPFEGNRRVLSYLPVRFPLLCRTRPSLGPIPGAGEPEGKGAGVVFPHFDFQDFKSLHRAVRGAVFRAPNLPKKDLLPRDSERSPVPLFTVSGLVFL